MCNSLRCGSRLGGSCWLRYNGFRHGSTSGWYLKVSETNMRNEIRIFRVRTKES